MNHTDGRFTGAGGIEIRWQAWLPTDPKAVVVIAHGAGEHSGRYAHVATRLVDAGYAVYALDHRGHGRSGGRRAVVDRMDNVVADLRSLIALAAAEQPGRKVFLLGHSMGGTISLALAARHQQELAGMALSGPVAVLEAASPALRLAAKVLSALTPGLGVFGVDPSLVSRDPDVVRAYREDPLVFHGKLPARTVAELAGAVEGFPAAIPGIRLPLLLMHGTADKLAPPAGSTMVHERAGSSDKTLRLYEGLYHEILNEPEQETVITDLLDWLNARRDGAAPVR
jgi:alpha-beta hydrolase superfamily lysophospholipase